MITYPIIIIDDDHDDVELIEQALEQLEYEGETIIFEDSVKALEFLQNLKVQPLFILCDVNMHQLDGLHLREALFNNPELRMKTIPFLFLSTSDAPPHIRNAYELCAQGYFIKPTSYNELVELLDAIIDYWRRCSHPQTI